MTGEPKGYAVTTGPATRDSEMKLSLHMSGTGDRTFWIDKVTMAELADE